MCVYQSIIYFCKTAFGTLIGNVLTSHGLNKAWGRRLTFTVSLPSSSPAVKWMLALLHVPGMSQWGLAVIALDSFRPNLMSGEETEAQRCLKWTAQCHTDVEARAKAGSSSLCPFGTFWYILFCERWEQGSRPTLSLTVSWLAISNWQE